MKITEKEYLDAKKIVDAYESELQKNENQKIAIMKKDLEEYFASNPIPGLKIEKFDLEKSFYSTVGDCTVNIIPVDPYFEECYWNDETDKDIAKIGDKYGIRLGWVYWVYPK